MVLERPSSSAIYEEKIKVFQVWWVFLRQDMVHFIDIIEEEVMKNVVKYLLLTKYISKF